MKKIGIVMSVLMSMTISLVLSLVGNLTSGRFTWPGFLICFALSVVLSLIIGFIMPSPKLHSMLGRKFGWEPGKLSTRALESLASDLLYTPLLTLAMVTMAWIRIGQMGGEQPPFVMMFLRSLLIGLVVAFLFIFLLTPLYLKLTLKLFGPPQDGPRP